MSALSDIIQWLHYHLGTAHTIQVLVIVGVLAGLLIGLLGMFLFIAFLSTRIRRDDTFPLKDRIATINFEIGGKRITAAPHPNNILESMKILLDAMLWTLFKSKPLHYKSTRKNRIVFCSVVGMSVVLILGCCVSTSDAFLAQIKHNPHYISWAKNHVKKNRPTQQEYHLANAQTVHEALAPIAPVHPVQQDQRLKKQNTTKNIDSNKANQSDQQDTHLNPTYLARMAAERRLRVEAERLAEGPSRIEIASSRNEENTALQIQPIQSIQSSQSNMTSRSSQPGTRLIQEVTSDGRQVVKTVSPDKILNTVQDALSRGAIKITIQLP